MEKKPVRIDMHHHLLWSAYRKELERHGIGDSGGKAMPEWTPELAIDMMDRHGISAAATGLSHPGVNFGDAALVRDLIRGFNEYSAGVVAKYPERFCCFGALPLPDAKAAVDEIAHIYDRLSLEGVSLLTSYGGKYLGHPDFDPVFAELDRRGAVVHIHPTIAPVNIDPPIALPGWCLEFVFDTTRAVADLAASGTLFKYPNIRFIVSHGGGTVPFIARRIARGVSIAKRRQSVEEVIKALQRLHYDTALTSCQQHGALKQLVPASQIVFGSDYAFASETEPIHAVQVVSEMYSESEQRLIDKENALRLIPRLAQYYA